MEEKSAEKRIYIQRKNLGSESKVFHRDVWLLPRITYFSPPRFLFLSKEGEPLPVPVTSTFPNFHPTFLNSCVLQIDQMKFPENISRTTLSLSLSRIELIRQNENEEKIKVFPLFSLIFAPPIINSASFSFPDKLFPGEILQSFEEGGASAKCCAERVFSA